jgi:RNA polymerase sigma factor (sigma-70 family)
MNKEERDRYIQVFTPMVYSLAYKYGKVEYKDSVQVGFYALIKALESYNPEKASLSTWANAYISGYIKNYIRKANREFYELTIEDDNEIAEEEENSYFPIDYSDLTPLELKVLKLYLQGYDDADISKIQGTTKQNINRSRLNAFKKLRKQYREELNDGKI